MRNLKSLRILSIVGVLFMIFCVGCSNDDLESSNAKFYITDAPIDNAEVKAVFVTVADIKIDGVSMANFGSKQTIDIKALNNGNKALLVAQGLESRTYSNIELVLDTEKDENGNAPGCYVESFNGVKHDLATNINGSSNVVINKSIDIVAGAQNEFLIDFDLRKSIKDESSNSSDYSFVTESELNQAFKIGKIDQMGTIKGSMNSSLIGADKIIVYAYKKGTYTESETSAQGASNIRFTNAFSSTVVSNNDFTLHFVEEGNYELHFAKYEEDNSGNMTFSGTLNATAILNFNELLNVNVSAQTSTSINVSLL